MTTTAGGLHRRILLGVALVCGANLLLEVVLTRIFSALMYYHFTFLAIALALLGLGASGVYVFVRRERFDAGNLEHHLAAYANKFALSIILALVYVLANPMRVITGTSEVPKFTNQTLFQLVLLNIFTGLPFFYGGVVVSLAISRFRQFVERVYFFDLAGAGLAALLAGPLLGLLGGPGLAVLAALLAAVGAIFFAPPARLRSYVVVAAVMATFAATLGSGLFELPSVKGVQSSRTIFEGWNSFSRITVERLKEGALDIKIDASAATKVTRPLDPSDRSWRKEISALAYSFHEGNAPEALIIGPGGGRDVAHALASGSRSVTGVEVNPIIANVIMKERFADDSDRMYFDERVRVVVDEGRSFIRRDARRYDVIQASLVDTWAATSAGAFALTENTLYTVEAFEDYYDHLSDRGVLAMSRWHAIYGPETLRLVLLAAGALERRGVAPGATRQHLFLATKQSLGTMLAKRTPFSPDEVRHLEAICKANGFTIVLSPTSGSEDRLEQLVDAGAFSSLVRAQPENLTPPTDDKPFFFYFVKARDVWRVSKHLDSPALTNPALWILLSAGLMLVVLTIGFVFVPLALTGLKDLRGGEPRDKVRRVVSLGYFALLGLSFMVVEIALMQRLGLFLGHPSYALLVVLFAVLVGTALGARGTSFIHDRHRGAAAVVSGLVIAVAVATSSVILPPLLSDWVAWSLLARVLLAGGIVFGFGLLMGVMMPLGIRLTSDRDPQLVAWGWGINGGMSVIGTVVATIIAIHAGFTTTFRLGGVLYAIAGACGLLLHRLGRGR